MEAVEHGTSDELVNVGEVERVAGEVGGAFEAVLRNPALYLAVSVGVVAARYGPVLLARMREARRPKGSKW
jgi:hypothetical protein